MTNDTRAELFALRTTLEQIRQEVESLRSPAVMQEFGLAMLQALFKQSTEPSPPLAPEPALPQPELVREPAMPKSAKESASSQPLSTDAYVRTLSFFPIPGLIVEADGTILAANVPSEELFGRSLQGTFIDELLPDRHRSQHAYWRAGFVRKPGIRLMGRGRSVLGLRGDGVEMDLDVGLAPFPDAPGLTFAFMVPRSARG